MGFSLFVTVFKNLVFFICVLEFLLVSSEWKVVMSMKHSFLDDAFLILYQAVCISVFFCVKFNLDLLMKFLTFHNLGT